MIILVNGHWNKFFNKVNASPGTGGEGYWNYFLGNTGGFITNAKSYFNELNSKYGTEIYVDGSSLFGGDQSGSDRKKSGYQYAKEHYDELTDNGKTTRFYFISHSEGCAYSAGIASFLSSQGDKVCESIMLSADEGDEFSISGYPCYQIVAGFLLDKKNKPSNFRFDPIVGDNKVSGVTRYGVYISESSDIGSVHGTTISSSIFARITQLKSVSLVQNFTSIGQIVYRAEPDSNQIWCKIDNTFVDSERIALIFRSVL